MGVNFHGCSDARVANGFGEGSQVEVGIILMLDVIMGYIGMPKAVNRDRVGQTDLFADLPVTLAGTAADATAEGEVGGSAYILVLPADRIVFLFDDTLGRLLLRTGIVHLCLSEFFCHPLIDDFGLFIELLAEHLEVHHGLLVQNNHSLTGFGFRRLGNLLAIHIDHVLVDQNGFAVIVIVRPGQRQCFPRLRGGFDSRIPLQKSLRSEKIWEIFFFCHAFNTRLWNG